ncbi:cathepsin B-like cysteine proteinase 5 [Acyrthosiphon pisum]|uniref:Peptidase C1A papain C-terminal domain-containing protein n=1 Tax=Acyrthosiphon pisum TaxID=7029 RepID=A0A8R2AYH2_ACYPI|nr:cathepsin B-like cysteine proteinase 5 [Acyrthosiphon pisum]|eukprot:XP_008178596.1 PREDICTED: cathepsin B-like cysteine proteinase 5 [Acyrthosiphon pisum]
MIKILLLVSIMLLSFCLTEQAKLSHDNTIDKSDVETNTLKAGENVGPHSAEEERLMLLGTRGVEAATKSKMLYKTRDPRYIIDNQIHKEFDARKRWPQCKTIGEVHNEGNELLSWAYAATGVFADRMCIATNGNYNQLLSTEELISCSGIKEREDGYVNRVLVWEYFKTHGLVSGGKYNTNEGCQPSKVPTVYNSQTKIYKRTCVEYCYGKDTINYNHDHVKVSNHYFIRIKDIQKEVQTYGPVSVFFDLHDDLFLYKSGVYAKTEKSKDKRYHHAKLIGWGVENGVDYWLLVNSWGYEWGQNGLFKIKRGTDECSVESHVYAGEPEIK